MAVLPPVPTPVPPPPFVGIAPATTSWQTPSRLITGAAQGGGLLGTARSALGMGAGASPGATLGLGARMMRGGLVSAPLIVGGNMLDESNWLGGSESAANDYASKVLKVGGVGAGIGTMIAPGVGTAVGAGIGGLVGAGWEGLERAGVLDAPTIQEQVDKTIHTADASARNVGLPDEVIGELKRQYQAQREFVPDEDKANRNLLAEEYAARLQQEALAYSADPNAYLQQTTQADANGGDQTQRQLIMQAVLTNAIKPYADNMLAQSNANAQSLENMAGTAGNLAPMYQQMAAQERSMGARYAADLVQQAQVTPYMQALRDQAGYLNQISGNIMSQAIGQVMNPDQGQAAGDDLTSIMDQYANQMQPQ